MTMGFINENKINKEQKEQKELLYNIIIKLTKLKKAVDILKEKVEDIKEQNDFWRIR